MKGKPNNILRCLEGQAPPVWSPGQCRSLLLQWQPPPPFYPGVWVIWKSNFQDGGWIRKGGGFPNSEIGPIHRNKTGIRHRPVWESICPNNLEKRRWGWETTIHQNGKKRMVLTVQDLSLEMASIKIQLHLPKVILLTPAMPECTSSEAYNFKKLSQSRYGARPFL